MTKIKSLIYCTKALKKGAYLVNYLGYRFVKMEENEKAKFDILNGKIVAECEIETEEIEDKVSYFDSWFNEGHHTKTLSTKELEKRSCLSYQDLIKYLGDGEPNEVIGYALHITNLNILDKALSLNECEKDFKGKPASHYWIGRLTDNYVDDNWSDLVCVQRAPTNMCWVWYKGERYVLISIQSKWLCKILNGEKTIEVRRKVLKGMVE